ncbi:hypothetical protein [Kineococcus arenarius]|uniref:hypothetical protein n=1 Tax=unclassified Kineococcus TaxID=2621656 RepID=UPI003D7C77CA
MSELPALLALGVAASALVAAVVALRHLIGRDLRAGGTAWRGPRTAAAGHGDRGR